MNITAGGMLIGLGIVQIIITFVVTVFVLMAVGMSDDPSTTFSWKWPGICLAASVGLILLGRFSGL